METKLIQTKDLGNATKKVVVVRSKQKNGLLKLKDVDTVLKKLKQEADTNGSKVTVVGNTIGGDKTLMGYSNAFDYDKYYEDYIEGNVAHPEKFENFYQLKVYIKKMK